MRRRRRWLVVGVVETSRGSRSSPTACQVESRGGGWRTEEAEGRQSSYGMVGVVVRMRRRGRVWEEEMGSGRVSAAQRWACRHTAGYASEERAEEWNEWSVGSGCD